MENIIFNSFVMVWCRKRAESDGTVADANVKAEKFAQRCFPLLL